MKLKELLIKSGGVISSIALLGSMFSMANAAADPSGTKPYVCALCNDSFYLYNYQNAPTYQQCYSTDTIVGLTNDAYHVYTPGVSSIKVNAAQYNEQYICENCLSKIVAEHKASPSNYISSPGSGNTPITVTADASTFSVTVPTSIPLVINADGSVTAPTDVKIVNGSAGSVQVSSIAMNDGDWTLTDYTAATASNWRKLRLIAKNLVCRLLLRATLHRPVRTAVRLRRLMCRSGQWQAALNFRSPWAPLQPQARQRAHQKSLPQMWYLLWRGKKA